MLNGSILFKSSLTFIFRTAAPYSVLCLSTRTMSNLTKDIANDPNKTQGLLGVFANNPKRFERIKFLDRLFKDSGYELRIAGGAVRDILRGVEPQDIDFATTARPEQSLEILKPHEDILRIIVTTAGQKHGTVAVKFKETTVDIKKIKFENSCLESKEKLKKNIRSDKKPEYDEESPFEITTLRCDNVTDGRHAEVEFVNDWRIDAERRDLTINAMFLTLEDGKLVDYFDGESDLKNGVVRFVGSADTRIREDYLRILRFFRFWSRYGRTNPDQETMETIKKNLDGLDKISGERLWQEIKKILSHSPCLNVIELMLEIKLFNKLGLFNDPSQSYEEYHQFASRELDVVQANVIKFSRDILNPKLKDEPNSKVHKKIKELLPVILFTSLLQSLDVCMSVHDRMKFSNVELDSMSYIIENRSKTPSIRSLKHQIAMLHNPKKPNRPQVSYEVRIYLIYKGMYEMIEELEAWNIPNFPITGQMVSEEVRKRKLPNDKIGVILESLKQEWASSDYQQNLAQLCSSMIARIEELERKMNL